MSDQTTQAIPSQAMPSLPRVVWLFTMHREKKPSKSIAMAAFPVDPVALCNIIALDFPEDDTKDFRDAMAVIAPPMALVRIKRMLDLLICDGSWPSVSLNLKDGSLQFQFMTVR